MRVEHEEAAQSEVGSYQIFFFLRDRERMNITSKISYARGSSTNKSDKVGGVPPVLQAKSTSEAAKETAQTVDSMRVHRRSQATSAGRES